MLPASPTCLVVATGCSEAGSVQWESGEVRVGTGLVGLLSCTFVTLGGGKQLKAERSGGALCIVECFSDSTVAIDM
jgi:hypothetical protein